MNNNAAPGAHCWDLRHGWQSVVGEGFPRALKALVERPVIGLVLYTGAMLFAYLVFERLFTAALAVPFYAYSKFSLTLSAVQNFGWTARILLVAVSIVLLLMDPARMRWQDFKGGTALRWAVGLLAVSMAWPFTTYGYNYALDSGHLLDRGVLAATFLLLLWRPVFIVPFLLLAYVMLGQLVSPSLGGSVLPHKTQVLRGLELFAAFYIVRVVFGYHRTSGFIFLLGCFVAVAYCLPAWAKLQIDWLSSDRLELVPLAAYAHGWRGEGSAESVVELAHSLRGVAPLLLTGAFVIEAAFVLFFLRYRLAILLLLAAIVFHLGVFYLFGFLFWTWIALDIVLIGLLVYLKRVEGEAGSFGVRYLPLSIVLIVTGPLWAKPPALGWYDTPLTYTYSVVATLDNNDTVRLNPEFFAPYEDAFTMTGFGYLVDQHGVLVGPYGATHDQRVYDELNQAQTAEQVFELEKSLSTIGYNEQRATDMYRFIEQFVRNRNAHGDLQQGLYALHSPRQFWSNRNGLVTLGDRKIMSLTVVEKTSFYDGNTLSLIRELPLHRINMSTSL